MFVCPVCVCLLLVYDDSFGASLYDDSVAKVSLLRLDQCWGEPAWELWFFFSKGELSLIFFSL